MVSQDFWETEYKRLEKKFVSYKDLCEVTNLDEDADKEGFSILPTEGRELIGKYIRDFRDMEDTLPNIIVRETVYKKLCNADMALKQYNKNYQLVVLYGYRTPEIQRNEFRKTINKLKHKYSDHSELNEAVHRMIAVPEVSGHPTGGAVDVTVYDFKEKKYLSFGTEIHDFTTKKVYYDSPEIERYDPDAKKNRKMLRSIMGKQDFVPYDGEWWHFSYGDKEWAFYKHRNSERKKQPITEMKYKYSQKEISEIIYTDKYKEKEFVTKEYIRLAVQKDGRLTEETLMVLRRSGIEINLDKRQFTMKSSNFDLELLFVRDDDIPNLVSSGIADLGIVGENVFYENEKDNIEVLRRLGFGRCSLALAVPKDSAIRKPSELKGKKIATSYPNITRNFFKNIGIDIEEYGIDIRNLSGSVEIAPAINYADAIVDLVSTGVSLRQNNLRDLQKIMDSETVLIANRSKLELNTVKNNLVNALLVQIDSGLSAKKYKYIIMNVPTAFLDKFRQILLNELEASIPAFDSSNLQLDDRLMIKLILEDENSLVNEIKDIIPEMNKYEENNEEDDEGKSPLARIKQVILAIGDQTFPSLGKKNQVYTLVNKDSLWENKLKKIGATDIIVLDVERVVN
jgi:ATP phosphoribosyltransferase